MDSRWVVAVAVLVSTVLAVMASWLLSWPEQDSLAQVLGGHVAGPLDPFVGLSWVMTGAVLAWLRPRNSIGWLLITVGGFQALQLVTAAYGSLGVFLPDRGWPAARWAALLGSVLWLPGLLPLANVLPAIYPEGRLPARHWRLPVGASVAGIVLIIGMALFSSDVYGDVAPGPSPLTLWSWPVWLKGVYAVLALLLLVGGTLTIWVMSGIRLARLKAPQRQQLAWVMFVVVAMFVLSFTPQPDWLFYVTTLSLPVAIGVGVFRYNLLGIEAVLRRALVYGTLTCVVFGAYLLVASLAGAVLSRGLLPGFVAAALVAVGLAPLRERLQGAADRLVYGEGHDPLRAVSRLSGQLAATDERDLLDGVLSSIATALRAPGALVRSPEGEVVATTGVEGDGLCAAMTLGGRDVGTLVVAARHAEERYSAADRRLLELLAPQVAVVTHALDLTEELQAERDGVVAATSVERDRLRRELHDGLGPSLAGVRLGLVALADALAAEDLESAGRLVVSMRDEVTSSVGEVRRIIDGLRPLGLDELGLETAMHRLVAAAGFPVDLCVSALPHLRPDVETAAYRIAAEALTNVGKHAQASHATVDLQAREGVLRVEVADDGRGFSACQGPPDPGVGMASMRHRAATLGGELRVFSGANGTTVTAELPLEPR